MNEVSSNIGICFPKVLKVLDALQVTVTYVRPHGELEHVEPIEQWKEVVFRRMLQAPHERPLVPLLARFYDSLGWQNATLALTSCQSLKVID